MAKDDEIDFGNMPGNGLELEAGDESPEPDAPIARAEGIRAPWMSFSKALSDEALTSEQMCRLAGLDWQVEKIPLGYHYVPPGMSDEDAQYIETRDFGCIKMDDGTYLGKVGTAFKPLQNADAFKVLDSLTESGKLRYVGAGTLGGNRIVFVQAEIPEFLTIGDDDLIRQRVTASQSHDGKMAFRFGLSPIAIICMNTLMLANKIMAQTDNLFARIRHGKNSEKRVEDLGKLLAQTQKIYREFEELGRRLAYVQADEGMVRAYTRVMAELTVGKKGREEESYEKAVEKVRLRLVKAFEEGPGAVLKTRHGTLWGLYNAATFWNDHERGRDDEVRAYNTWYGGGAKFKEEAMSQAISVLLAA